VPAILQRMTIEREDELVEKLVERQVLPGGTYLTFVRDTVLTPDGARRTRDVVLHPGAVTVVAIQSDRRVLLVRQYRHASGEVLLELPAGTLDMLGDGSVEQPLPAAQRELFEETGHRAGHWRKLAEFFTAPGFASELMHLYLATEVTADASHTGPQEDERLELEIVPFDEAIKLAESGQIRDAKTLVGLYLVDRLAREGEIKELA
jgi:ADP-ribose pyrophosphatase